MEAVGGHLTINYQGLDAETAEWVQEHLYCTQYHLSHRQYLDEPVYAVRWRLAVADTLERRTRDAQETPEPDGPTPPRHLGAVRG